MSNQQRVENRVDPLSKADRPEEHRSDLAKGDAEVGKDWMVTSRRSFLWRNPASWLVGLNRVFWVVLLLLAGFLWHFSLEKKISQSSPWPETEREWRSIKLAYETLPDLSPNFDRGFVDPLMRWFPHRHDGVINPLWPWLAATIWNQLDDPEFLQQEKGDEVAAWKVVQTWFPSTFPRTFYFHGEKFRQWSTQMRRTQSWIAFALLALMATAVRGPLRNPTLALFLFGGGLPSLIGVSMNFNPDILTGVVFLMCWILIVSMLRGNVLWKYAALGACFGLCYLLDDVVISLIWSFFIATGIRFMQAIFPALLGASHVRKHTTWTWRNHFVGLGILLAGFIVVAGPRLQESLQNTGDPLFRSVDRDRWLSTPRVFDTTELLSATSTAHLVRQSKEPSITENLSTYLHQHTLGSVLDRLADGVWNEFSAFGWKHELSPQAKGWVLPGAAMLLITGVWLLLTQTRRARTAQEKMHPETGSVWLFFALTTLWILVVQGWSVQTSPALMSGAFLLFPCLLYTFCAVSESVRRRLHRRQGPQWARLLFPVLIWMLTIMSILAFLPNLGIEID